MNAGEVERESDKPQEGDAGAPLGGGGGGGGGNHRQYPYLAFVWSFNFIDQHLTLVFPPDSNMGGFINGQR